MRKILFLFLIILFVPNLASASFLQKKVTQELTCLDNQTLQINQTWLENDGTTTYVSETSNCPFGCNEKLNACHTAPIIRYSIGFLLIMIILLIIFRVING